MRQKTQQQSIQEKLRAYCIAALKKAAKTVAPYSSLHGIRSFLLSSAYALQNENEKRKAHINPLIVKPESDQSSPHLEDRATGKSESTLQLAPTTASSSGSSTLDPSLLSKLKLDRVPHAEELTIDKELVRKLTYSYVKRTLAVPFEESVSDVSVAMANPLDSDLIEELRFVFQKNIRPFWGSSEEILSIIHRNYQQDMDAAHELLGGTLADQTKRGQQSLEEGDTEAYDLMDDSKDVAPAVRLLNFIIAEAIKHNASDIHFDPEESGLHVRYRIDGVLQTRMVPPQELQSPLVTRLKVMSRMDIAERRLPQDGRIKMKLGAKSVDFRVSTLPVSAGERVVLRILDKGNIVLGLDQIGMPTSILHEFRKEISSSEGMILVTGPTGSGKTTTLYSALSELKNDEVNIMTIEDPVEYRLPGIAQMGVHPKIGLTFATGLRHILRQDPDIIMIGEIRDKETAEIAIQSSLTGHLVLSTLHTNDAPSAITRLVDMGVEPYLISSCCIGALAQRLVRKICSYCHGDSSVKASCPLCLGSGFSGRLAIYELMPLTPTLKRQILVSPEATKIKEMARKEGMMTLLEHGNSLVQQGLTTQEEVWRVTRGGTEDEE